MSRPWLRSGGTALGLCVALSVGCSPERRVERHRERAEALRERGDIAAAVLELRSALQIEPENVDLCLQVAELLAAGGETEHALFLREEAYRLAPERADAAIALASALAASDPARSDAIIDAVIAREPELAAAYGVRSEIAMLRDDLPTALAAAERGVELAAADPRARLVRARARFAALAVRGRQGEAADDASFQEILSDLDVAIAGGTETTPSRARGVRARLLAVWPGRDAEAERAFRERLEIAFASEPAAERLDAARAAARYATRTGNEALLHLALEKGVLADPASESAWRELALAEERAGRSADRVFERLLAARPGDPAAARLHAQLLAERGRGDEAIASLAAAADASPDSPELLEMLVHVLFDFGRGDEGAKALERLEREHPDAPATKLARAREAVRAHRPAEALPLLVDLTTDQDTFDAQLLLAVAYLQLGRIEPATDAIERAKELGGTGAPRLLRFELRIDQAAGRWREVLRDLRMMRRLGVQPSAPELVAGAEALYELGRPVPARRILEQVIALPDPPPQAALEFSRREAAGDPARAAQLLESALARSPNDLRLALERARLLLLAKQNGRAEAELLALLDRAPGFYPAIDLLLDLHRREGSMDRAIAALQERAKRGELTPASRIILARLARSAGRLDLARDELELALTERPDLPVAARDLASILAEEGNDLARARSLAEEARAALPADSEAARVLGRVLLRSGDASAALAPLDAARALSRGRPDAGLETERGLAFESLGRKAEARAAFEAALRTEPDQREAREGLTRLGDG